MDRGRPTSHFNLPIARRDSASHHLAALAWTCAAFCIVLAAITLSIALTET